MVALVAASLSVEAKILPARQAYRLSMENDAKLIESVAAHLEGVAQLQRVIVEDLDWKNPENKQRRHVSDAVKAFKNSQVLLSESMANTALLIDRLHGDAQARLRTQLNELRGRTGDLEAKNSAVIKELEAQQLPTTESLHDLTRSMMAVIDFGTGTSQKNSKNLAPTQQQ
jgi:hypothetical protein